MIPYAEPAKKMSMEDKILRKFQVKSALLTMLMVGFVALFSAGCGDDRDEFVATNNNGGNGELVFRFQQAVAAQAIDIVPNGTTQLVFSLHAGAPASTTNLVEVRGPVAFQNIVTLTGVPTNVTHVVVTALGASGQPLAALTGNVIVQAGVSTDVDLNDQSPISFDGIAVTPDPINLVFGGGGVQGVVNGSFSNGSIVSLPITNTSTTFVLANAAAANVSATGLFTGLAAGTNSAATASYTLAGVTKTDAFQVNVYGFEADALGGTNIAANAGYTAGFVTDFVRSNGVAVNNITTGLSYSLSPTVSNLTINPTTGAITNSGTTSVSSFDVVVTWTDTVSGLTFTDRVPFTVVAVPAT